MYKVLLFTLLVLMKLAGCSNSGAYDSTENAENRGIHDLSWAVILPQKEATFKFYMITAVIEKVMSTISKQDAIKVTISSEDIFSTNSNKDVPH